MKVLVTGGCGFLGTNLCEYYIKKGAEVIAYDNMTKYELDRTGYDVKLAREHNRKVLEVWDVEVRVKDVLNFNDLLAAATGCDFIVHAAAQPAMTIAIQEPILDAKVNILGGLNVLEVARQLDIPLLICSTIHIYGNGINKSLKVGKTRFLREPPEINEKAQIMTGDLTPLHISKRAMEMYAEAYIKLYGCQVGIFRLTGMYGPRQFGGEDHGWVANFAIKTLFQKPITVFGTDKQVRDILYVDDACEAIDAFYRSPVSGVYNIGGGFNTSISIKECLNLLEKITGKKPDVAVSMERVGDLYYFVCNVGKAKNKLGWKPKVIPEEGLRHLVGWIFGNSDIFGAA